MGGRRLSHGIGTGRPGAWSTPLVVADAYEDECTDEDANDLTTAEIAVAKILKPVRRRRRRQ